MAYYLRDGKSFCVTSKEALNLHESLPVGNYTVQNSPTKGFYLEEIDKFTDIKKHYGNNTKNADRIYRTFANREQSTGVMLTGEKGSGKSLLAKTLSIKGYSDEISTIVINAPWRGDAFNKFIQSIDHPTIILFDEFEKVYDPDEQLDILTLLDGVYPSKKLFILTCNNKWRVDSNMRNRPGRIFYMIDFNGLEQSFVREYCEDNLKNKLHIEKTCNIASLFNDFNFDMLKALVEEMNRYEEDPVEALRILNAKPEYDTEKAYTYVVHVKNKVVQTTNDKWSGNPLKCHIDVEFIKNKQVTSKVTSKDIDDVYEEPEWDSATFISADIVKVDTANNTYTFKNKDGNVLTLTKVKPKEYNYLDGFQ